MCSCSPPEIVDRLHKFMYLLVQSHKLSVGLFIIHTLPFMLPSRHSPRSDLLSNGYKMRKTSFKLSFLQWFLPLLLPLDQSILSFCSFCCRRSNKYASECKLSNHMHEGNILLISFSFFFFFYQILHQKMQHYANSFVTSLFPLWATFRLVFQSIDRSIDPSMNLFVITLRGTSSLWWYADCRRQKWMNQKREEEAENGGKSDKFIDIRIIINAV